MLCAPLGSKEEVPRRWSQTLLGGTGEAKGQEPMYGKFHLNTRRNFFTVRVTTHWHRPPREVADSPSLEISQTRLRHVLWDEKGGGIRRSAVLPSDLTHPLCDPAGDRDAGLREELPELPWKSRDSARIPQRIPPQRASPPPCRDDVTRPRPSRRAAGAWR